MLKSRKNLIRWILGAVLVVDLILLGINWEMATSPQAPRNELTILRRQDKLLEADVTRARLIRQQLPDVERQGEGFFNQTLHPVGSGYSALISDLEAITQAAGLQSEGYSFRQHGADKNGVIQVDIGTAVSGDYASIVRFINALERSDSFYILDRLSLAAGNTGQVRLNLQLRTYFRTP